MAQKHNSAPVETGGVFVNGAWVLREWRKLRSGAVALVHLDRAKPGRESLKAFKRRLGLK